MSAKLDVSVIIPCYNSEETIGRALRSVVAQTEFPREIICVDDGSQDRTLAVIEEFKLTSPVDVVIIEKGLNSGPAESRNIGIERAQATWIAFLDSDDFWFPEKLGVQMAMIREFDLDIIGSGFVVNSPSPVFSGYSFFPIRFDYLVFRNKFPTPSVVLKKSNAVFNVNMRYAEDFDLWLRLLRSGKKAGIVVEPLLSLGKPSFGHSGLSSSLARMERGELVALWRATKGMHLLRCVAVAFSLVKFIRRLVIVQFRRRGSACLE